MTILFGVAVAARPCLAEVTLNGFGDVVGSRSSSDYPVDSIGNAGRALDFDTESRLGLNLSSTLADSLDFAGQIVGRGSDGGAYSLKADWLFLTYHPSDQFKFRIGRQISPTFLFSEQYDVGYTYLWTRLPYEVYGSLPVKEFTGASAIYTTSLGRLRISGELYGGSSDLAVNGVSNVTGGVTTYTAQGNNVKGFTLDLRTEDWQLRAAYNGSVHSKLFLPGVTTPYDLGTVNTLTLGTSYDSKKLLLLAEGIRISNPNSVLGSLTGAYATVGYHLLPVLTPYVTYAWTGNDSSALGYYPGNLLPSAAGMLQGQSAWAAGVNYHAWLPAVVKLEIMRTAFRYAANSLNFRANTFTATTDFVF